MYDVYIYVCTCLTSGSVNICLASPGSVGVMKGQSQMDQNDGHKEEHSKTYSRGFDATKGYISMRTL